MDEIAARLDIDCPVQLFFSGLALFGDCSVGAAAIDMAARGARAEALEEAAQVCDGYAKADNPDAVTISLMAAGDIRALKDRRP